MLAPTSLTSRLLLIAVAFLVGGFALINRFAPEPTTQIGDYTITQRGLYTGLFCIGEWPCRGACICRTLTSHQRFAPAMVGFPFCAHFLAHRLVCRHCSRARQLHRAARLKRVLGCRDCLMRLCFRRLQVDVALGGGSGKDVRAGHGADETLSAAFPACVL